MKAPAPVRIATAVSRRTIRGRFAPGLGAAYQINSKTVFRAGWGIVYGRTADGAYITNTAIVGVGYNTIPFTSTYGEPAVYLQQGLQYNPADLNAATFSPGIRPQLGTINSPPYYIDPSSGRPSRVNQWNISLQRQLLRDLVVEAAYVGNRGAWLQGDRLQDWNGLTAAQLQKSGFDITNAADRAVLTSPWNSAAAVARGIKAPYAGYPTGFTVAQTLRPYPQFGNITSRWTALGNSWYDSLQAKVTKRFSHNFDATGAFTWQKELSRGLDANNDVYNLAQNKYISSSSQPLVLAFSFNYRVPTLTTNRVVQTVLRGLDGGRGWSVRQRLADSGAWRAEQSKLAAAPSQRPVVRQPRSGPAVVPERPELPLHRSQQGPGSQSGCLDRSSARPVGDVARLLQRLPAAAPAFGTVRLRKSLRHPGRR